MREGFFVFPESIVSVISKCETQFLPVCQVYGASLLSIFVRFPVSYSYIIKDQSTESTVTKIRFKDGTEYLVRDDNTANYMFAVGNTGRDVTFLFNRMIDINEISSVILDGGLEFSVS